ncbi:MAG TPA: hypothetical protein VEI28_06890, partial [Thermodesulfovibrionales bacterium]|nr:hypothetical protein [Thermodesulfovibrionales bacterium]
VLKVSDNGRGIKEEAIFRPVSFGIMGMRERVADLGGSMRIRGVRGKGTTLLVRVPIVGGGKE